MLVIGGTNFIGPFVVRRLIGLGHEVTVFHRGKTEAKLPSETRQKIGDRRRLNEYTEELQSHTPEVVLDMIPMNEYEARDVMRTFRGVADRVVAVSSQDVYRAYDILRHRHPGPPDPVPLSEDSPLREELYPYKREGVEEYEKILVEKAFIENPSLPGTVLRLPAVYGSGDYRHRLLPYLKRMDDERPAIILEKGLAQWRWTHGYVEDVAEAITLAVTDERAAGRIYSLGERKTESYAEWLRSLGRVVGWNGVLVEASFKSTPDDIRLGGNFDQHLVTDTDRIRQELDYEETTFQREALSRTVEWERLDPPETATTAFDYAAEDTVLSEMD